MASPRSMRSEDVARCAEIQQDSLNALRRSIGLGPFELAHASETIRHLLTTDPAGSTVALDDAGKPIGFSQAARRDHLWVLAHLFVDPESQGGGTGKLLLESSSLYGRGTRSGIICSSPDPRAITLYGRLRGFTLIPAFSASGTIRRLGRPSIPCPFGDRSHWDFAADVDRRTRGASHGPDFAHLTELGSQMLLCPGRGYAFASETGLDVLAATDEEAAQALLLTALSLLAGGNEAFVSRLTATQQWALRALLDCGLEIRPWGPLVLRASPADQSFYLPSPSLC